MVGLIGGLGGFFRVKLFSDIKTQRVYGQLLDVIL